MSFSKKKKYGQNFLTSPRIPERIVSESGISENDCVLEIGPGMGILTKPLAEKAKKVVCVEIDNELIPFLEEKFVDYDNVSIINADILKTDLEAIFKSHFDGEDVCVCANLPYYITTPILTYLFESKVKFKSITVMVQKEMADRISSKAGEKEYSSFSAYVSYFAEVKKLFTVPASAFSPPPKVNSAVVKLSLHKSPPVAPKNIDLFFKVLNGGFSARRKTLVNSLNIAFSGKYTKEQLAEAVREVAGKESVRGEELDIEKFSRISDILNDKS